VNFGNNTGSIFLIKMDVLINCKIARSELGSTYYDISKMTYTV